jgi:hypothetical protein
MGGALVSIGIGNPGGGLSELVGAPADAKRMAQLLGTNVDPSAPDEVVRNVTVELLTDEDRPL